LIEQGDYGKVETAVKEALLVSLNRNLGIDYFKDPMARLEAMSQVPLRTPTTWLQVDDALFGGLARTEIILFSANSGGGKSITLANLALNFVMQKLNVLYITLELSEPLVAQRFDTMFTGVPTVLWQKNYKEIGAMLTTVSEHAGELTIKHMPSGTTSNTIRAYLKEFELKNGYVPDLLIVDYLDIMGANEYVSADNVWEKDKRATEQLRDIGFDYNMFVATASQQNRAALDAEELHQGHIAGGISKVNTVDVHISIILNPSMKASGEIGFQFLKTRNSDGVGKTVYLRWDNTQLRIINPKEDLDIDNDGVILNKVAATKGKIPSKKSLSDLMDI
jgi:KaiC/GvpD/RAD55 family RecA-like ATPase